MLFRSDPQLATDLLFVAPQYREENSGQIREVVKAVLLAPAQGIDPFRTLFAQGKLPSRADLLALFRPVLTEAMIEDCARGTYIPGGRFSGERPQIERIFRRLGLAPGQAKLCARSLAPPDQRVGKPRRNPAEKRCLETFVLALQHTDIHPLPHKPAEALDRLARFGLTRGRYYALRRLKFSPQSLTNTPENRRQISKMAKALRLDPSPFYDALLAD